MAYRNTKLIKLKVPVSDEFKLTNREKIIVLRSSKIHGCVFPPWKCSPHSTEFENPWQDETDFRLSKEQKEVFDGWRRCSEQGEVSITRSEKVDLVQDIATDCSVVASLCALTARSERLGSQHEDIQKIIRFPVGASKNGKYVYKLHFNGCFRKVVIDDRLPTSKVIRSLHCFDRNDPRNTDAPLMEKAYLKVRGGYDFAGSNSGTDLWILTGWIPEQLFLQSEEVTPRGLWKRLYNAFKYGDVLITLGTDNLSRREEMILGLVGRHAYAIIDMKEEDDLQFFLVKNPWANGGTWTGYDEASPISDGFRVTTKETDQLSAGVFWMDLHKVITCFHTIYLNWNPGLFNYRNDVHFSWNTTIDQNSPFLSNNPQYLLRSQEANTVYLVLTRHFQDRKSEYDTEDTTESEFLSLHAYDSSYRVLLRRRRVQESLYLNAPNVLLRLELPANTCYTIVVAEQNLSQEDLLFTLTSFSLQQLSTLSLAPDEFPFSATMQGSWSIKNAGGNAGRPRHSQNPHFSMVVPCTTDLALILAADDLELAVHIKVVWSNGKRIPSVIASKEVYGDSGDYSRRCAMIRLQEVPPGIYTVVCSTFEEGQLGNFTLNIKSSVSGCILKPIPRDEAGLIVTRVPTAYLRKGVDRLLAPVSVVRNSRVHFIARNPTAAGGNPCSPLKLSIEYGQGPTKDTLRESGEFSGGAELRTTEIDLSCNMVSQPGPGVWLVIERVSTSFDVEDEHIEIEILSNIPGVQLGAWGKESDETIEVMRKRLLNTTISKS